MLSMNLQFVIVGLELMRLQIAPPLPREEYTGPAELLMNVQFVITGLLLYEFDIAPPYSSAELFFIIQLTIFGLLAVHLIPPP